MAKGLRLFLFGPGYSGLALARRILAAGGSVIGTARSAEAAERLTRQGVEAVDIGDANALAKAVGTADAVLVTAPPDASGCPGLRALEPVLRAGARPGWIGYLSTTGVYGDRAGGWVRETSALEPVSEQGRRRVAAEAGWRALGEDLSLTVTVFRLPGIYGPSRSAFDRLREGTAQRVVKPGQVFSRIHVEDIASALAASLARPRAGGVYNLCDDAPGPPQDVITFAASLLGVEPPPLVAFDAAGIGPASRRFYGESKRVANALAKAELGWRPAWPSYREGLTAILAREREAK